MHSESGVRGLRHQVADVIVVGGGGSGLAAASAAASAGAKTIVLEKNAHLGGTTRFSVGSITASGTRFQKSKGIHDTPDEHFSDMSLFLTPEVAAKGNLELRRVLVDHIPDAGVAHRHRSEFLRPDARASASKAPYANLLPNSRAYPYYLSRECRRLGVDIQAGVRAQSLIVNNGEVVGLVASDASGPVECFARGGVVLASGDFSASLAKAQNLAHVDAVNPASAGDGHAIAASVGAWIRNPDVMWGPGMRFKAPAQETLLKRLPPHRALPVPMAFALAHLPLAMFRPFITRFMTSSLAPEPALLRAGAMLVNRNGARFGGELDKPELKVPSQPEKDAFIVFDERVAALFSRWPNFVSTAPGRTCITKLHPWRRLRRRSGRGGSGNLDCRVGGIAGF